MAHRQQLAELEWLLQLVDRHASNPFALPAPEVIVAHQVDLLLRRTQSVLEPALAHRAANHARSILLELNQSLRELRRLLASGQNQECELARVLDRCISRAEAVSTASEFDEIAGACERVYADLTAALSTSQGAAVSTSQGARSG